MGDGQTIMDNMKIGASSTSFAAVKTAFENIYACMNITCEEVGGLWFSAQGKYYEGAEPCPSSSAPSIQRVEVITEVVTEKEVDKEVMPSWAMIIIIMLAVLLFLFLTGGVCSIMEEKKSGKPVFAFQTASADPVIIGRQQA